MPVHVFSRADLTATPWKNGGGVTREIACMPAGAGTGGFDWRMSIAHVAVDGPFSAFDGIDRVITLLEGEGMRLFTSDGRIERRLDRPLSPWAFAGEEPILSILLGKDCHDFNVMTRRGTCQSAVEVIRKAGEAGPARAGLLLAHGGSWVARSSGRTPVTLQAQQGLWWHDETLQWHLRPEGSGGEEPALIAVTITFLDP